MTSIPMGIALKRTSGLGVALILLATASAAVLSSFTALLPPVKAQFGVGRNSDGKEQEGKSNLPFDRDYENVLTAADVQLAEERWDRAIGLMQQILDAPGDYFHSDGSGKSIRTLVDERFSTLPKVARDLYDRQSDAVAVSLIEAAAADEDEQKLNQAVRQYFHTTHGLDAAWELAHRLQDRGEMVSASRLYDRLSSDGVALKRFGVALSYRTAVAHWLRGDAASARVALERLKDVGPKITIEGREVVLFMAGEDPVEWLQKQAGAWQAGSQEVPLATPNWLSARGGDSQNRSVTATPPVWDGAWSIPLIATGEDSAYGDRIDKVFKTLTDLESEYLSDRTVQRVLIPSGTPLVVDGNVIFHGPGTVKSVSIQDGKMWRDGET
ncbi:MAG: hypothetical protein R3C01_17860, partial [Planctomycetaceae bacterium]